METDKRVVALTFDAAWQNSDTRSILHTLRKHEVKVTFFVTGHWANDYPDDLRLILAEGHELGNHSANHLHMTQISDARKKSEIMNVHRTVKKATGLDMNLFRAPHGDYDNALLQTARNCGYSTIQWDVDSRDREELGVDAIVETVTGHPRLKNGSIILCHAGTKYTALALDRLITTLKQRGYGFVSVSELILRDNYRISPGGQQTAIRSET